MAADDLDCRDMRPWRDRIQVHPAAELFLMMTPTELDELGNNIKQNGQQVGVILWTSVLRDVHLERRKKIPSKKIYLLDGRNRLEAISRIYDDPEERAEAIDDALYQGEGPRFAALLYGETDPYAYVVSVNLHRRHLTPEQKRELVAKLLADRPERSDRATAKLAHVSPTTVGAVRATLVERGEVSKLDTRVGVDGVAQPATKPAHKPAEPAPRIAAEDLERIRTEAPPFRGGNLRTIDVVSAEKTALRQLDALVRDIQKASSTIRDLPLGLRVPRARLVLAAMGVKADDLRPAGEA